MNKQQKAYAIAKAAYETALHEQEAAEREYIEKNGIKNSDGTVPRRSYNIDDEVAFDEAMKALEQYEINRSNAFQTLIAAEDALIEYGLSIVPTGIAETLRGAKDNLKYREKIIDLTFRLDAKTVKR